MTLTTSPLAARTLCLVRLAPLAKNQDSPLASHNISHIRNHIPPLTAPMCRWITSFGRQQTPGRARVTIFTISRLWPATHVLDHSSFSTPQSCDLSSRQLQVPPFSNLEWLLTSTEILSNGAIHRDRPFDQTIVETRSSTCRI